MGLDWDWPEFPPPSTGDLPDAPLAIEVVARDLAGSTLDLKARQEIGRWRLEVDANPASAHACNCLAWAYLTAPEALRDVETALPLAKRAVRLASGNAAYRTTLGVAYYRAGRYREAVEVLRPNLARQEDSDLAHDLHFLAMSHHRLGEAERARDYYDLAVRWARAQPLLKAAHLEELAAFRAEAEQLLGIDRKSD
jgi:tetratricopeptide (TPR) repeat protein